MCTVAPVQYYTILSLHPLCIWLRISKWMISVLKGFPCGHIITFLGQGHCCAFSNATVSTCYHIWTSGLRKKIIMCVALHLLHNKIVCAMVTTMHLSMYCPTYHPTGKRWGFDRVWPTNMPRIRGIWSIFTDYRGKNTVLWWGHLTLVFAPGERQLISYRSNPPPLPVGWYLGP